jgi:hypothetical protein
MDGQQLSRYRFEASEAYMDEKNNFHSWLSDSLQVWEYFFNLIRSA